VRLETKAGLQLNLADRSHRAGGRRAGAGSVDLTFAGLRLAN